MRALAGRYIRSCRYGGLCARVQVRGAGEAFGHPARTVGGPGSLLTRSVRFETSASLPGTNIAGRNGLG